MNIIRNVCLVMLILFLFACTDKRLADGKGQLVLKDSILINENRDDMDILEKARTGNAYIEDSNGKSIMVTNTKEFVTCSIPLQHKEGSFSRLSGIDSVLKKYDINAYYFHTPDSIIGMSWAIPRVLYLFDVTGHIKKVWHFHRDSADKNPIIYYGGNYYTRMQFDKTTGELCLVANTPYMPYITPAQYYNYKQFAIVGLDKDSAYLKYNFGSWPQFYQTKNYGLSGSHYSAALFNGYYWVSFCKSDSIYGYKNGQLVKTCIMSSPNVHQSSKYFDTSQELNYDYIISFCYEQSIYYYMLTDQQQNYLYRIATHENGNYYNPDSTTNHPLDKPWSVVVAGKDMNVITEKVFDAGLLDVTSIYVTPKGLWIRGRKENTKYFYYEVVQ